ncbi:hypothetical protein HU200_062023 [Digitaria exilis]|uniref:Transcription factor n=1 Tax=Digitaria exilis TaxID=1010633 RepID=A0A835DW70_9POAL|nr:hypothetical protein HU200_062023 [Digitaria exilis]CAB3481623.1 unnamed protein product [Digitaria exilis]
MDELVCPGSSSSSPSPSSFFSTAAGHHHQELEFVSGDVLEEWLGDNDWLDLDEPSPGNDMMSGGEPPAPAPKSRGRKPRPKSTGGPPISHVEAERQRRDKLNRRFCELRAAVPTVSRMDKASLLADAANYIAELRGRVEQLEAETKRAAAVSAAAAHSSVVGGVHQEETLEVRMVGRDAAALRLTTAARHRRHAAARFMVALRSLDLGVQHACVCVVGGGVTVQDAVVDVPAAALRDERVLRAALVHRLQQSG